MEIKLIGKTQVRSIVSIFRCDDWGINSKFICHPSVWILQNGLVVGWDQHFTCFYIWIHLFGKKNLIMNFFLTALSYKTKTLVNYGYYFSLFIEEILFLYES